MKRNRPKPRWPRFDDPASVRTVHSPAIRFSLRAVEPSEAMNLDHALGKVHVLTPAVIGRIAAGEVIERPAAVVKELIENSLDAGSTSITVDIKDGGLGHIRVIDNGEGMIRQDVMLAFERHATSK